jgi:hypothetical protein
MVLRTPAAGILGPRMRGDDKSACPVVGIDHLHISRFQTAQHAANLVPAARLRPGHELVPAPIEGWAERRQTHGVRAKHPVGSARDAADQALARRLASNNVGRSPLGAPPWRFLGSGSALPSAALPPQKRAARLLAAQVLFAWRADSRASLSLRLRAAAAGRHTSLRLWTVSGRRPSMSKAKRILYQTRCEVNKYLRIACAKMLTASRPR